MSKAVEDFGWVIREIVVRPFTSRRNEELVECLRVLRKVCLEEDEVEGWNELSFPFLFFFPSCFSCFGLLVLVFLIF